MAYRKLWWKYGATTYGYIKARLAPYSYNSTDVKHSDTYYDRVIGKTMHLVKSDNIPNSPLSSNRVWVNSDMFCAWSLDSVAPGLGGGDVVMLSKDTGISSGVQFPIIKKTVSPSDASWFCGVIATDGDFNPNAIGFRMWGIAQQGLYYVKFDDIDVVTRFIAGNMAIISSTTPGRATQGGRGATTGVIGVIASTESFNPDWTPTPLVPVIIQSYSSK